MALGEAGQLASEGYFRADDGVHGEELWKTDGTSAGTGMVQDINPSGSSNPYYITNLSGQLFFSVTNGGSTKLWGLDTRVADLYYTDQWQVAEEQILGQTTQQYVWSPVYVDAMILRDRDLDGDGAADDERVYPMHDANFNVTGLLDDGGNVIERYLYDPYGVASIRDANWSADADKTSDVSWNYLHQGGRYDVMTGMYHFRHREYDPSLGRWVQQDPMGYVDGFSRYAYERSAPVASLDPLGLAARNRQSRLGNAMDADRPGLDLLRHYFTGGGKRFLRSGNSGVWQDYLQSEESIRFQVLNRVQRRAADILQAKPAPNSEGRFWLRFHLDAPAGEGITGYNLLGGTNANAGDFFIKASYFIGDDGCSMDLQAEYQFNDILDPNFSYDTDLIKWAVAEGTQILPGIDTKEAIVQIFFFEKATFRINPRAGTGWPFEQKFTPYELAWQGRARQNLNAVMNRIDTQPPN